VDHVEAGKHWAKLHEVWKKADDEAREAERRNAASFMACAQKNGPGPAVHELSDAGDLRAIADRHKAEVNRFLAEYFAE
jgi:hypothetical protein